MARKFSSVAAFSAGFVGALAISLYTTGCSSGNTSGGEQNFEGSEFVADGNTVGRLILELNSDRFAVADTAGFRVYIRDANDQPVSNVRVTCATETGLALVEPTTSSEITDGNGQMSGLIGCAAPGSFRMGCRLPGGGNLRQFASIVCTGTAPAGFGGFQGAPQGGLGAGGVFDSDDAGPGGTGGGVRISSVTLNDTGNVSSSQSSDSPSIDTTAISDCDGDLDTVDPEPFFDTAIKVLVTNNSNSAVTFTSLSYRVPEASGNGSAAFSSSALAFIGNREVAAGESTVLVSLFANATSGSKFFTGSGTAIPAALGFRTMNITLNGRDGQGGDVVVQGSTVASFGEFNRCG